MNEKKNKTKHLSANIKCLFKTELRGNFWRILKCSWVLLYDCYVQFFVRWHSYTVQCLWETELDFGVTVSFIYILIFCSIQTGLTRIPSDWANFLLSPSSSHRSTQIPFKANESRLLHVYALNLAGTAFKYTIRSLRTHHFLQSISVGRYLFLCI